MLPAKSFFSCDPEAMRESIDEARRALSIVQVGLFQSQSTVDRSRQLIRESLKILRDHPPEGLTHGQRRSGFIGD